jgi:predicted DNA-binding transcriptional regulator YafY
MPRSDQQIRQWKILAFLEANGKATLQRLASELDDACHERTLRRDLDALGLAGFPIYDQREDGRTFWVLDPDYRRFPVPLTATELFALQCGAEILKPLDGTFLGDSLHTLLQKTRSALTAEQRRYLGLLQRGFSIEVVARKDYQDHRGLVERIKTAVEQCRTVEIRYVPLRTTRPVARRVNPYLLRYQNETLYLIGYDHLRKTERTFAVDRIRSLSMTDRTFNPPLYFSVQDYFKDAFGVFRGKPEEVELIIEKQAARWVRERRWHDSQKIAPLKGGRIRINFRVAVSPELLTWVLGFGSQVRVIRPESLKKAVQDEAWRLLGKYQGIKARSSRSTRNRRPQSEDFSNNRTRKLS